MKSKRFITSGLVQSNKHTKEVKTFLTLLFLSIKIFDEVKTQKTITISKNFDLNFFVYLDLCVLLPNTSYDINSPRKLTLMLGVTLRV